MMVQIIPCKNTQSVINNIIQMISTKWCYILKIKGLTEAAATKWYHIEFSHTCLLRDGQVFNFFPFSVRMEFVS